MLGEDVLASFADVPVDLGGLDFASSAPDFASSVAGFENLTNWPTSTVGDASPVSDWASRFLGGLGDMAGRAAANPLDSLSRMLGLGTAGLTAANAIQAMQRGRTQQQNLQRGQEMAFTAAQPAIDYGTQTLAATSRGQLPAAMETWIDDIIQRQKMAARARMSQLGISDSTMMDQRLEEIERRGISARAALLNGQTDLALRALGLGGQQGAAAGTIGAGQDQQINQMLADANRMMGLLAGRQ